MSSPAETASPPPTEDPLELLDRVPDTSQERLELLLRVARSGASARRDGEKWTPYRDIVRVCRRYCADALMEVRAVAYRTLRLSLTQPDDVYALFRHGVNVFLIRSLARDVKHEVEREQAIRLIRACIDLGERATAHLPVGPVRALVAMAEHADEPFRNLCLETLCELAIRDPELTVESGGLRVMLHVLVEGSQDLSDAVSLTLLYLLDRPANRQYLRPGMDIEALISPLTNGTVKGTAAEERVRHCTMALRPYLTSWVGLNYLCMDKRRTLRSLIMALRTGHTIVQVAILELLSHVLDYPVGDSAKPRPNEGRSPLGFSLRSRRIRPSYADRIDLLDHHMASLLVILMECELLDALSIIVEKNDDAVVPICYRIITRLLRISQSILPSSKAAHVQALSRLVETATSFRDEVIRHHATASLMYVDEAISIAEGTAFRLGRGFGEAVVGQTRRANGSTLGEDGRGGPSGGGGVGGGGGGGTGGSSHRGSFNNPSTAPTSGGLPVDLTHPNSGHPSSSQGSAHTALLSPSAQAAAFSTFSTTATLLHRDSLPDEGRVKQMIQETFVLAERDYTRWDWDLVSELFHTALRNSACLVETLRTTSFLKRVLAFYRPRTGPFPDLLMNSANLRFLQIGCDIIGLLSGSMEGVKYLHESRIIREMSDFLGSLLLTTSSPHKSDPNQGPPSLEATTSPGNSSPNPSNPTGAATMAGEGRVLTEDRLRRSLSWGYFWILMSASKSKEGLRLLEKSNVFDVFFRLADLPDHEQIRREILLSMDYRLDGYPRIVLGKMMASATEGTRTLALAQLRYLAHMRAPGFRDWGIRLLVEALYDVSPQVCALAVQALDEACAHPEYLEGLVRLRPVLEHLGPEAAKPLFLRLLSSPYGYECLLEETYIQEELESWVMSLNEAYVATVEVSMARAAASPYAGEEVGGDGYPARSQTGGMERTCCMPTFTTEGISPPHMYGALAHTSQGCRMLRDRGRLHQLLTCLKDHLKNKGPERRKGPWASSWSSPPSHPSSSSSPPSFILTSGGELVIGSMIRQVKAALWALGYVGITEQGWSLLQSLEGPSVVLETIMSVAELSPVLSIRGTAFHALGLLGRTVPGMEALREHGWETAGASAIRWWWWWQQPDPGNQESGDSAPMVEGVNRARDSFSTSSVHSFPYWTSSGRPVDASGHEGSRGRRRHGTLLGGWGDAVDGYGTVKGTRKCSGLCLPMRLNSPVFSLHRWRVRLPDRRPGPARGLWSGEDHLNDSTSNDSLITELLSAASSIGNHILANTGSKTLVRLRTEHPELFMRMDVWLRVVNLLECFSFRLSARRFLLDLFDITLGPSHSFTELDGEDDWHPDLTPSTPSRLNLPERMPGSTLKHPSPTPDPRSASGVGGLSEENILPAQALEPSVRIIGGFGKRQAPSSQPITPFTS
ncbi:MAG: Rapamycin-insensitive companion of mTOR, N-term-domain-containing protein [Piptocephalis tieghemiana]|nr:MAG: Rapamycin-insensitive companion of mTOR, N-term-domain-containing protein [Piptocephalis tieghemiana]